MPQKVLRFAGINRKINEFQGAGACEELINLRPTTTGLEVVKPKKVKRTNANYDVYTHAFGNKNLTIGVEVGNNFDIYVLKEDGGITPVDSFAGDGPDYSIAFIGNQMLFSHNTTLRVYAYKNNEYVKLDAAVPDNLNVTYSVEDAYGYSQEVSLESSNPASNEFKQETQKHWSAALGENSKKDAIYGPILVAFNFELTDGTEFWTNKWIYINPFLYLPHESNGKHMIYYESGGKKRFTFDSYKVNLTISQIEKPSGVDENMIRAVNIYATRPVFPYNIDTMTAVTNGTNPREIYAYVTNMNDNGVTKQLLYFQKSIPIEELESGDVFTNLDFGETQVGEKVLEVDNGPVKRAGSIASYNNRAHVYDSYATIFPQSVVCLANAGDSFVERDAYVYLDCNGETVVLNTKALVPVDTATSTEVYKISCCYPDARAKKILIQSNISTTSYSPINLVQSSRYNFAWGEADYPANTVGIGSIKQTYNVVHEANTINVSAQYNPFVFPVEYSYGVGGKILDLATSYLPISSTQVGQYPLTVFTTNGVYTMEQGSGSSLYSNIVPVQPLVIEGKAAATPYGTFFISSKNLYMLSGRESINLSYILNGERELNLRDLDSYKKLCCNKNSQLVDFSQLLSGEDFEDFISDATLTYDQFQNELYISSGKESIPYSYVFNLNTKAFHKIAKRYLLSYTGSRYVVEATGTSRNLVDLHIETSDEQPILLQSRPMSLEVLYTHIQRLMLLVDAKLTGEQNICFSVFGSDNLYDWKCIISSQKQKTVLRQIRTNRAAKSYKDYIILINGLVSTDTDLSDIIADYTVVNRRLG